MPFATDELIKDLLKNPKQSILYIVLVASGWAIDRIIPDDCQREVSRWQSLADRNAFGKDSIQQSKDVLYEDLLNLKRENKAHLERDKKTDSLIFALGKKAESTFKHKHHEH
jgi:hypothetical protein